MGIRKNNRKSKKSNKRFRKIRSKKQRGGTTPNEELINATRRGNIHDVRQALDKDADVNAKDNRGWTALIQASNEENPRIVEMLLEKGADVNAQNNYGNTALIIATNNGRTENVEILLKEPSIDVNVENYYDETALTIAINISKEQHSKEYPSRSSKEILVMLQKQKQPEIDEMSPNISLIESAQMGDELGVINALDNGANINWQTDILKNTALIQASRNGFVNIVVILLNKGADVNIKNERGGYTALMFASTRGRTEIVAKLLEKGADVNVVSDNGWTALLWASYKGYIKIIKLLLEYGADVKTKTQEGWTAFMYVSRFGSRDPKNENMIKLLKQYIKIPIMSEEDFKNCDKYIKLGDNEETIECGISLEDIDRSQAVNPVSNPPNINKVCFKRSELQRWLSMNPNNPTNPCIGPNAKIDEEWINEWYPLGLNENYGDMTGGKKRTKKTRKTRK